MLLVLPKSAPAKSYVAGKFAARYIAIAPNSSNKPFAVVNGLRMLMRCHITFFTECQQPIKYSFRAHIG